MGTTLEVADNRADMPAATSVLAHLWMEQEKLAARGALDRSTLGRLRGHPKTRSVAACFAYGDSLVCERESSAVVPLGGAAQEARAATGPAPLSGGG